MKSQQPKGLKLIAETFFEMCYTGDFGLKGAHELKNLWWYSQL